MGCILLLSLEQQVVNRERASRACESSVGWCAYQTGLPCSDTC